MVQYRMVLVLFLCLVYHMHWTLGKKEDKPTERDGFIICSQCSKGQNINKTLNVKVAKRMHKFVVDSVKNSRPSFDNQDFKTYLEKCKSCEVGYTVCKRASGQAYLSCTKNIAQFGVRQGQKGRSPNESGRKIITKRSMSSFPHVIEIPIGGLKDHSRQSRSPVTCSFPTSMNTAAITCIVYPNSISCDQRCAFGYTLVHGIRQQMNCSFKENRWVPHGFEECRPFIDCSMTLISGGSAICTSMSLDKGPDCRVECKHYEDKDAVPEQTYSCDIEGKWNPALPFCASAETGLMLARPPKIKLHGLTKH